MFRIFTKLIARVNPYGSRQLEGADENPNLISSSRN